MLTYVVARVNTCVCVKWWTLGGAHLCASDVFRDYDSHHVFTHQPLPSRINNGRSTFFPERMEYFVYEKRKNQPTIKPLQQRLREKFLNDSHNFEVSSWSMWYAQARNKLLFARERLRLSKRKESGEVLGLLYDWAKAHTYDVLSEDPNFDEHTVFVAAYEIAPDIRPFPEAARERKEFKPKHVVRIALTSIAMSYMLSVLSLNPEIFPIVTWMSNATHKMSIAKDIKVIIFICMLLYCLLILLYLYTCIR